MKAKQHTRLPLFPLNTVIFPNEKAELYIFEPRYYELVHQCEENEQGFGIVPVINGDMLAFGTEVDLLRVKRSENGTTRIQVRGKRIFRLVSFKNKLPGHLYGGGDVIFRQEERALFMKRLLARAKQTPLARKSKFKTSFMADLQLSRQVYAMFAELQELLKQTGEFIFLTDEKDDPSTDKPNSHNERKVNSPPPRDAYAMAPHIITLDLKEKAVLLTMEHERERLAFIYKHMEDLLLVLRDVLKHSR